MTLYRGPTVFVFNDKSRLGLKFKKKTQGDILLLKTTSIPIVGRLRLDNPLLKEIFKILHSGLEKLEMAFQLSHYPISSRAHIKAEWASEQMSEQREWTNEGLGE